MAINSRDELISAMGNSGYFIFLEKTGTTQNFGGLHSFWLATGYPSAGVVPTTASYCTKDTVGAAIFQNPASPKISYLASVDYSCSGSNGNICIDDRIAHLGGLNGNTTATQTASLNLLTVNAGGPIPDERRGLSNFSEISWALEWYTSTGSTNTSAKVGVVYHDGTTEVITITGMGASITAGQMRQIFPATANKFIRAVTTVELTVLTGTAGNFGVTAFKHKGMFSAAYAYKFESFDWSKTGLDIIGDNSCIFLTGLSTTTSATLNKMNIRVVTG